MNMFSKLETVHDMYVLWLSRKIANKNRKSTLKQTSDFWRFKSYKEVLGT